MAISLLISERRNTKHATVIILVRNLWSKEEEEEKIPSLYFSRV